MRSSLSALLLLVSCGGASTGATSSHDASTHDDARAANDARATVDGGTDSGCGTPPPGACPDGSLICTADGWACSKSSACVGPTPTCFGTNNATCCGDDPLGLATCSLGVWSCGEVAAPGCNGTPCISFADAGRGDAGHILCGSRADGGAEQFGNCPENEQCCDGPLTPSFYCYAGDAGCPMLQ